MESNLIAKVVPQIHLEQLSHSASSSLHQTKVASRRSSFGNNPLATDKPVDIVGKLRRKVVDKRRTMKHSASDMLSKRPNAI
jgi:hypothetical protein